MTVAQQATANGPLPYRRRRPERTLLYRTVQTHFETWLALTRDGAGDDDPVPDHVEREFRRYLECGILAHGFARARCGECGHDFLIAFSCYPQRETMRSSAVAADRRSPWNVGVAQLMKRHSSR